MIDTIFQIFERRLFTAIFRVSVPLDLPGLQEMVHAIFRDSVSQDMSEIQDMVRHNTFPVKFNHQREGWGRSQHAKQKESR
jgi:hypothetical protein